MQHPPPRRRRHLAVLLSVFALIATVLGAAPAAQADFGRPAEPVDPMDKIEQGVFDDLDTKNVADYWVRLSAKADTGKAATTDDWTTRGQQVVDELKSTARRSQAGVRKLLDSRGIGYEPYWITNAILVRDGDRALAERLAAMDAVEQIRAPRTYQPPDPVESKPSSDMGTNALEWGVENINADDVWADYGVTGEGIVVANIDSGVDYDHPALVDSYRGNNGDGTFDHDYNWFDATGTSDEPFDGAASSHGTHTMGTMAGDDGEGNQIGVAPGVQWIAANGCNTCSDADLIASGEWMLAPTDLNGENPDVSMRPHIINNSWGSRFPSNDPFMEDILNEWAASGIFGVWSNGNSGSSCESSGSPGSRIINYSVGAYDSSGSIASFSARGPGQEGEIKPNIAAPGVDVRSSVDGGGYGFLSGTSMASPHVAGAIALLWSGAPALIGDVDGTRTLLNETAIDTADDQCGGTPENNNVWGEGKLDALALLDAAPTGDTGTLAGTVTDADGAPVEGATVSVTGPMERETSTDAVGAYGLTLSTGSYAVTVSAFGYETTTTTVEIVAEETATHDVTLETATSFPVSGTVTDAVSGEPVAGATVTVDGTSIAPATTDATGAYTFDSVPAGSYTVTADGGRCSVPVTEDLTVDGPTTLDVVLEKRTDGFGYFCSTGPADYVEGDTPVGLSGDESTTTVELPFDFPLYGESYDTAYLSTNGHLNFLEPVTDYSNSELPESSAPNAALYPFWDDMRVDDTASVHTGTVDGGFVIEYRDVEFFGDDDVRVDFAVTLHEDGSIDFAYRNLDPGVERELGASATVGIENADGTDALQYSFNEAALSSGTGITFALPPNGFVSGTVTDANDGLPVAGATVSAVSPDGTVAREVTTGDDGSYSMQLFLGSYTVRAANSGYVTGSDDLVVDTDGETNTVDFALNTGVADIEHDPLSWTITEGQSRSGEVTVTNTGSADLNWEIGELIRSAGRQRTPSIDRDGMARQADPNARTALGLYTDEQLKQMRKTEPTPTDTGDVLRQWNTEGVSVAWGTGYDGDVWVSDPDAVTNHQFSPDGTPGDVFSGDWGGTWNGDMAQDTSSGAMCQVNVGGDNAIHCFDQADGSEQYTISGSGWTGISQRGLAYNPTDDTFYVGGWNEGVIYTVAGRSHDNPGETLAQCTPEDGSIAGLAYNPTADVIWMVNSSLTTYLYQLSPENCETISTIAFPEQGSGPGAGLAMNASGALWATSQLSNTAYLIDSGVPNVTDVPWVGSDPSSGTLAPGESTTVTVTVDSTGIERGLHEATLNIATNAGRVPTTSVPVSILVPAYRTGVNAGGGEHTDGIGDLWSGDQRYSSGSWGWVGQRAQPEKTGKTVGGTDEQGLFQSRRQGIFGYRFDDVPAGTYEVELGFAEFKANMLPARRVFDVSVNGDYVLVNHDVAAEVRGLWADEHTFVVEHEGGPLEVTFHDRFGYQLPIVNALRVTDRPDL
ncbi:subtilisin family serine protease [Haloactinopolyspora alba]|uniref:Subtilisin family serine protease n=1 Tax=Haloactinopolyspora alba TaxID=648780 RepID=A0A2P8EFP1_9ACTN|nr:carboxypeptidase regulatory-like domain-containing protein [Haloactinopolyspora alba]PSL08287.1 subtilisin family serine protease [Haloactinopolyspora alba]